MADLPGFLRGTIARRREFYLDEDFSAHLPTVAQQPRSSKTAIMVVASQSLFRLGRRRGRI